MAPRTIRVNMPEELPQSVGRRIDGYKSTWVQRGWDNWDLALSAARAEWEAARGAGEADRRYREQLLKTRSALTVKLADIERSAMIASSQMERLAAKTDAQIEQEYLDRVASASRVNAQIDLKLRELDAKRELSAAEAQQRAELETAKSENRLILETLRQSSTDKRAALAAAARMVSSFAVGPEEFASTLETAGAALGGKVGQPPREPFVVPSGGGALPTVTYANEIERRAAELEDRGELIPELDRLQKEMEDYSKGAEALEKAGKTSEAQASRDLAEAKRKEAFALTEAADQVAARREWMSALGADTQIPITTQAPPQPAEPEERTRYAGAGGRGTLPSALTPEGVQKSREELRAARLPIEAEISELDKQIALLSARLDSLGVSGQEKFDLIGRAREIYSEKFPGFAPPKKKEPPTIEELRYDPKREAAIELEKYVDALGAIKTGAKGRKLIEAEALVRDFEKNPTYNAVRKMFDQPFNENYSLKTIAQEIKSVYSDTPDTLVKAMAAFGALKSGLKPEERPED